MAAIVVLPVIHPIITSPAPMEVFFTPFSLYSLSMPAVVCTTGCGVGADCCAIPTLSL